MENCGEGNSKIINMKIGFIGLGLMGSRMASCLQGEGISLSVYNRSKDPYEAFDDQVEKHTTADQCVKDSDVVFTMLSTIEVIEEVALGQHGFLKSMKQGSIWIDCSTVSPSFSRLCGKQANQMGVKFVEAPVAGSTGAAAAGQLVFLVGGEDSVVNIVTPLLNLMGKKVMTTGVVGSASAAKLLINYALASAMMNLAEIVTAGKSMGLSNDFLFDQLPQFPVIAPFLQFKAPKLINGDFSPEFPLEWMVKDINLLVQTIDSEYHLPMIEPLLASFMAGMKNGQSREDFSSVIKTLS